MLKTIELEPRPALHQLFVTHRQRFINAATRILGCRASAEDVVQDAFVKMNDTAGAGIESQSGYLMRVVRNLAIDHYRRQALEKRYKCSEEEGLSVTAVPGASPETLHEDRQALDKLALAMQELPSRTRYAFEQYRLVGRSQKDIAQELGVSPTLVNFMIRDALVHCRKTLRPQS
ncbi:RNA polymerase factor sigma-70 [Pseudomonas sp. TE3610]